MFLIDNEKASQIVQGLQIPAKPQLLNDIQEEEAKTCPDLGRISEIISSDVALAANVIKAINSPVFGLNRTITDIQQSVMMLGMHNVLNLVTYFEMRKVLAGEACIPLDRFWDRSVETARMMSVAVNLLNLKSECPLEDAYSLGLFCDCGIAMMAMRFDDYFEVLNKANNSVEAVITQLEEERYNTTHAVVGYYIATSWNLPEHISGLILRHHDLDFLEDTTALENHKKLYGVYKIVEHFFSQLLQQKDNEWEQTKEKILFYFGMDEQSYDELMADIREEYDLI